MLAGESNENSEKTTIGVISRKATLHVQHTFFVYFFPVVLQDCNVKLPETSWLHVFQRKCRTCSCSLFFFFATHFHPGGRCHFSFSHLRYKISSCSSNKNIPFVSISFSVLGRGRCDHHFCPLKLGCFGRRVKQSFSDDPFGTEFGLCYCLFSAKYGAMIR